MPLYGVLPLRGINSSRKPKKPVQRIYIENGNTIWAKVYAYEIHAYIHINIRKQFDKDLTSGYKIVIILCLTPPVGGGKMGTMKGGTRPGVGRLSKAGSPYLEN